jgi:agmatine deiminase
MAYFLPPEWHPQQAVLLTWPHVHSDWAPVINDVEPVFVEIATRIAERESLILVCYDQAHRQHIQSVLPSHLIKNIHFYIALSDDTWARDHGPLSMIADQKLRLMDFVFNGWGNKFSAKHDNAITKQLQQQGAFAPCEIVSVNLVLEGGSIEVDGQGTLLTTARCLLANNRNSHLNCTQIEKQLRDTLGVTRFLWLNHGFLKGDDTDSHIDTLARFTDPHTICYVSCDDAQDEHYDELRLMAEELKQFKDYEGNPYRLVPLPWPAAKYSKDGWRLPATYANFLIINDAVLVPIYSDSMDEKALIQLKKCFPTREIIAINCMPIIQQGGSLHCLTMQIPCVQ